MEWLQLISIGLEFVIVVLALTAAVQKKVKYCYGFALTFAIYVFYDLAKLYAWTISPAVISGIFFVATVSAMASMWMIYKE